MKQIILALVMASSLVQGPGSKVLASSGGQSDVQALPRMLATERAFAAATAEIGVRDGFLTFFADDAIALRAGATGAAASVVDAKTGLREQPLVKLPAANRLMWDPIAGQISSDGSMGWLTGPYANTNVVTKDLLGAGAYFSVWKRQADGTYRVWLDEGVRLTAAWRPQIDFRAAPEPDAGTAGAADDTIETSENAIASGGDAWRAALSSGVRLHWQGRIPVTSAEEPSWPRTPRSRDLLMKKDRSDRVDVRRDRRWLRRHRGPNITFVRVWKRDVTGRWRVVFQSVKAAVAAKGNEQWAEAVGRYCNEGMGGIVNEYERQRVVNGVTPVAALPIHSFHCLIAPLRGEFHESAGGRPARYF